MSGKKPNHKREKRMPPRLQSTPHDIYIGRNSPFDAQLKRAQKLLDDGQQRIVLHGLGAAINRCINLALKIQHIYAQISVETDTVPLVDDLPADDPQATPRVQSRNNSAVHITIKRRA